ncbi:MAG: DUF3300 domain-containing protein [Terrimicrobiaceae bacterium]|nr:DUF3300 domain-containing protein [Terrimicrobiaceae bacterium]
MKIQTPHSMINPFQIRRLLLPALLLSTVAAVPLEALTSTPAPEATAENAPQKLSADDLADLLGPIALYPDALVAIILPAATVPSDVTLAARYLNNNGDPNQVASEPWDDSVKSLVRYPDVLKWMDENLEWTSSVGEAFVEQPADVMNAIQQLRAEAKSKGNLADTPQQTVVVQHDNIRIVPTNPEVIYVPQYDPEVVYVQPAPPDYGPLITFGAGLAVGAWLNYDFDWYHRDFYHGDGCGWNNQAYWNDRGGNHSVNVVNTNIVNNNVTNNTTVNRWHPSAYSQRQFAQRQRQNLGNARIARANPHAVHNTAPGAANLAQHSARVPRPARFRANQQGNAAGIQHPKAAAAAGAPANVPGQGPNSPGANGNHHKGNHPNNPGGGKHNVPNPGAAPSVNGQAGGAPGATGSHHKGNHPNNPGGGKHNMPNPGAAPSVNGQPGGAPGATGSHHKGNHPNNPGGGKHNVPNPGAAPSVNDGQAGGAPGAGHQENGNRHHSNNGQGNAKHHVSPAPGIQSDASPPHAKPRTPSSPPQYHQENPRPHPQSVQQSQPSHHVSESPQQHPHRQQAQVQHPQAHPNASLNQNQGSGNKGSGGDKKKKKKDEN